MEDEPQDEPESDEYQSSFDGPCTCDHEPDEHGWGSCDEDMPDGSVCPCEAGWSE